MSLRQKVIDLANEQGTNKGGRKYWSWWGYTSRVPWCQIFVSWIMAHAGVPQSVYGKYENCQYAIEQMKKRGVWHGRGYRPQPGDICYYDWKHDGVSDHVGIVITCSGDTITVREGNKSDAVGNRTLAYNDSCVMGYAAPKYDGHEPVPEPGGGSCAFTFGFVRQGSKGNDVRLLQLLLNGNGCIGSDGKALEIDGSAGANTIYALKSYQRKKSLECDGIAGCNTWKSILMR